MTKRVQGWRLTESELGEVEDLRRRAAPAGTRAQLLGRLMRDRKPVAGDGVTARLIGTVRRPGGGVQLAYAGHLLYRWAGDRDPGEVRGQAVGAIWFVVRPDGNLVRAPSPTSGTFSGNAPTSLIVVRAPLGPIVADATGAPLYMFKDDPPDASNCTSLWFPPTGPRLQPRDLRQLALESQARWARCAAPTA